MLSVSVGHQDIWDPTSTVKSYPSGKVMHLREPYHMEPAANQPKSVLKEPSLEKGPNQPSSTINQKIGWEQGVQRLLVAPGLHSNTAFSAETTTLRVVKGRPFLTLSSLNVKGHYQTAHIFSFLFSGIKYQTHN